MRLLVLAMCAATAMACRPEKLAIPHDPGPRTNPEVQHVAERAPADEVVHAPDGGNFELSKLWAVKRVVLVFYMGHWCPHCQRQLADLNTHAADFAALDTTLVAVSADPPDDAGALKTKLGLAFDLYSDADLAVIGKWGVADYGANIAKPATFIIEPGGAIAYRKVGENQTDRPTADEVLAALRQ
jgi:peroxiredoxin